MPTSKFSLAILMGLSILGFQIISLVVLSPLVLGLLPEYLNFVQPIIVVSFYMLVPIYIFYVKTGTFRDRFLNLKDSLIWGVVFCAILNVVDISIVALSRYSITGEFHLPSFSASNLKLLPVIVFVIYLPILEEILYRGYIQQFLLESTPKTHAVLITAALGTLAHLISYHGIFQLIVVFIGAIIFCLAYIRGGLLAAMIVHSINNLLVCAQDPFLQ